MSEGVVVGLAERLISETDWASYRMLTGGPASGVGAVLQRLFASSDPESATVESDALENEVAVQGNLYSAAEPAVRVLAASLADPRPRWVMLSVLDLMFLILSGYPVADEIESGNGALLERCTSRVRESLWLIVRVAIDDAVCVRAALDVLEIVDEDGVAVGLVRSLR